jgi:MFS transporter, ACS family, tartrate transporter
MPRFLLPSLVGAPIAGWLLGVHWPWLSGWRWLFILEGIPAIGLGIVTVFYLTDYPTQARWLPPDERVWLALELQREVQAQKKARNYTILEAFRDPQVLLMIAAWFLIITGMLASIYWIPTFVKRLSGLPTRTVTSLLMLPAFIGLLTDLLNGWHSDRTAEQRWHTAVPLLIAGLMFGLSVVVRNEAPVAVVFLLLGAGFIYACQPVFWTIPAMMLSESAAAATFGLINSVGQLGGFAGPYMVGVLNDRTHSLTTSFAFTAIVYVAAGIFILSLKVRNPFSSVGDSALEASGLGAGQVGNGLLLATPEETQ